MQKETQDALNKASQDSKAWEGIGAALEKQQFDTMKIYQINNVDRGASRTSTHILQTLKEIELFITNFNKCLKSRNISP